ncbi:MAG TPA: hypothetical protein VF115_15985 [Acidimicrobiia bacterium]
MARHRKPIPPWLMGLMIAAVVFVLVLVIFNLLGFGDDPVVEGLAQAAR